MRTPQTLLDRVKTSLDINFLGMGIDHERHGAGQIIPNVNYPRLPHLSLIFNHTAVPISVDGVCRRLEADTLCLWDCRHKVRYGEKMEPWRLSWFQFCGQVGEELVAKSGAPVNHPLPVPGRQLVERHWVALHEEFTQYASPDLDVILNWLNGILLELRRLGSPDKLHAERIPEPLRRVRAYIDEHYLKRPNLSQLAAKAHLAPAYLSRAFKEHYGVPPLAYANELLLNDATFFLRGTALQIQEIAARLGHGDSVNFSKLFKRHYHMSPQEFRDKFAAQ